MPGIRFSYIKIIACIYVGVIESEIKTLNEKVESIYDVCILQKLYWMKIFLEKHKVASNEMIYAENLE